jgi:Uma2 family endonuclease
MSVAQRITEADYEEVVWAEPQRKWELVDGRLQEKPGMTLRHSKILMLLGHLLLRQLDHSQFTVLGESRVRRSPGGIFIPDLIVLPNAAARDLVDAPGQLAIISEPALLVVEIWSRSTGTFDVETKVPDYKVRGDHEIWRVHPYERTLTAWRRQPDGTYSETIYRDGTVTPATLPEVAIDLAELFAN